jgi:hypothetical protein
MFGFLAPARRIPKWRQSYARVCQFQRKLYGLTSLPFLSYEAAFLYRLAIDFELLPELPESAAECCRLRRLRDADGAPDFQAAKFSATFGVLLAGIKLQDDVQDSGRWFNRLLLWKYRRQIEAAHKFVCATTPGLELEIAAALKQHAEIEVAVRSRQGDYSLDEYSQPTGKGFGAVFAAFARLLKPGAREEAVIRFREIGEHVGRAIIGWDCAVDFEQDRIKGHVNPLKTESEVQRALEFALLRLAQIGWQLPESSICLQVLSQVSHRIRRRRTQPVSHQATRRLERWGLIREKRFAYARCDGCEGLCLIGECCECAGGAAEAASCCTANPGSGCCCDVLCFIPDCVGGNSPKKGKTSATANAAESTSEASEYARFQDRAGIAASSLNPSGFVTIESEYVPARSQTGDVIEADTSITVVSTNAFGVFVRETKSSG